MLSTKQANKTLSTKLYMLIERNDLLLLKKLNCYFEIISSIVIEEIEIIILK